MALRYVESIYFVLRRAVTHCGIFYKSNEEEEEEEEEEEQEERWF